jgi:hypothetical protein
MPAVVARTTRPPLDAASDVAVPLAGVVPAFCQLAPPAEV